MNKQEQREQNRERKIYLRHRIIWFLASNAIKPFLKLSVNLRRTKTPKLEKPYIVLSNHVTNLDPAILAASFKKQMYFIASEQFYRSGFKSKLLYWAFQPISKIKGASDKLTVMKAIRTLKEGKNVALFPEGNRTFNGESAKSFVATGKLIKISGAGLVTYKIEGGYMTFPRWGFGKRKGRMKAGVVKVYSPEELKLMTAEEIVEHINEDIYTNAYEEQKKFPVMYKGKNLAFGMESAFSVCPECKKIGFISSQGDSVFCTNCGTKAKLDQYGFFNPEFKFKTVLEWDKWQEDFYKDFVKKFKDPLTPLFQDKNVAIRTVNSNHHTVELGYGTFSLYLDRFIFEPLDKPEIVFEIKNVPDTSVYGKSLFCFSDVEGTHYELHPDKIINVRKYLSCWNILHKPYEKK